MKKMKTILSVLLAAFMLLSMMVPMASAAEYSDVPSTHKYYKAITDLSVYGILNGFEDGSFRPEEGVTRAQFAKIICYALNVGDLTGGGAVETGFTDVDPNHWAAGNIKMAASMGIINGMGDGTFAPENPVLYEQAVKMIVCALGYSRVAEENGGYPYGHMTVASNIGVLKSSDGVVGAGANRATIANLVNNMLEADQVTSTGEKGESLKDQQIKTESLNGQVVSVYGSTIYANTQSPCSKDQIQLLASDGQHYTFSAMELGAVKNTLSDFLGRRVTVYYSAEDELPTPILTNLVLQANKNIITEVDFADIIPGSITNTEIEYTTDYTFGDTETVSVSSSANIMYNGVATSSSLSSCIDTSKSGQIIFLDSNNDLDADVVFIKEYTTMIVKSKATSTYKLTDEDTVTGTTDLILNETDSSKSITIKRNGASAEFKNIANGDVVSFARSLNGNVIEALVSNKVVSSATVSSYNSSQGTVTLRVSGKDTEYKLSEAFSRYTSASIEVGMTGKFFIDAFGKIAKADLKSDETYTYAYLIYFDSTNNSMATPEYAVKVINMDGSSAAGKSQISLAAKFKIDNAQFTESSDRATIENALTSAAITFNGSSAYAGDDETKFCQVIKYSTNAAGKIDRIITVNHTDAANKLNVDSTYISTGARCTTDGVTLENILNIKKAKVLLVPEARKEDSLNKFKGYGASYFSKGNGTHKYKVQLIDKTTDDDVPYIISYGTIGTVADTSWTDIAPVVVKDIEPSYDESTGETRTCLVVLTSDSADPVRYYEGEETVGDVSTIAIGDIIRIDGEPEGEIDEFKSVVSLASMVAADNTKDGDFGEGSGSGASRQYRHIIGTATKVLENALKLKPEFVAAGDPPTLSGTEERFDTSSAKFIIVDSAKVASEQPNAIELAGLGDVEGFDDNNQDPNASKIVLYSKSGTVKLVVIFK